MTTRVPGRVVITGAGSGIGRATAFRYAALGSSVIAVDIDAERAEQTVTMCRSGRGEMSSMQCDVADPHAVDDLAKRIETDLGPVDVMVNNAGVGVAGRFLDISPDDWTWLRSINVDGVIHGCRSFGKAMVDRRHGHIVNVASGAAYIPSRRLALYCASKAAVVALSQSLRAEWSRCGVGVSVICPGVINTPILTATRLAGSIVEEKAVLQRIFDRSHSPDLVAKAIVGAAERNRAMVPVGIEAHAAYHLLRMFPWPLTGLIAKA